MRDHRSRTHPRVGPGIWLVFAVGGIGLLHAGQVQAQAGPSDGHSRTTAIAIGTQEIANETMSQDTRSIATWVVSSGDNRALPFLIVDKVNAKVFAFDAHGALRGTAPALLGLGRSDLSPAGIGQRKLATITPAERTTPAGRFEAVLGHDFEQDILWIDYEAALSLHRVIVGRRQDHRADRLASATVEDNRISYGCVNVPARFYDDIVKPLFTGTIGIVYILPEARPLGDVFPASRADTPMASPLALAH